MDRKQSRRPGSSQDAVIKPAASPLIFAQDGRSVALADMYCGQPAFLLCGGPSLRTHDLSKLQQWGVLTMAVNNAAAVFRPNLWVSVDDPGRFADSIWRDPGIIKFAPLSHVDKRVAVRNSEGNLAASDQSVSEMPAVFYYCRNSRFDAARFLYQDTVNWGNSARCLDADGNKGSRSVLLVALRLLFYLGVRRVYLLGCDFRMEDGRPGYAFEQDCSSDAMKRNNNSYRILNDRFARLRPFFQDEGFEVLHCTPNSGLTAFPHVPFEKAVAQITGALPDRINTSGMYDRSRRDPIPPNGGDRMANVSLKTITPKAAMSLEIVSHCWQYSRLLTYQLSSLVLYPPREISVTMTVFHARSDKATMSILEFFERHRPKNVQWQWRNLDEPQLFRRAIGRNIAALSTEADWIWFCDCDQVFHKGCLDSLANSLTSTTADLVHPESVYFSRVQSPQDDLLSMGEGPLQLFDIDPMQFIPVRFNRAVGGLQIVRGDVARKVGYCKDIPEFMRPADRWMRTFEDAHFRRQLGVEGEPIRVPGLFRIEHEVKGRRSRQVAM